MQSLRLFVESPIDYYLIDGEYFYSPVDLKRIDTPPSVASRNEIVLPSTLESHPMVLLLDNNEWILIDNDGKEKFMHTVGSSKPLPQLKNYSIKRIFGIVIPDSNQVVAGQPLVPANLLKWYREWGVNWSDVEELYTQFLRNELLVFELPEGALITYQDAQHLLTSGNISSYETDTLFKYLASPPNQIVALIGTEGQMHFVLARIQSGQMYPPISIY
jgi:hypothetical protein